MQNLILRQGDLAANRVCSLPGGVRLRLIHGGRERHIANTWEHFSRLEPHTHAALHIVILLEGENLFRCNGKVIPWRAPQGVLIDSFVPHEVRPMRKGAVEYLQLTFAVLDSEDRDQPVTWTELAERVGGRPLLADTTHTALWQRVTPDLFAALQAAVNEDMFLFGARFLALLAGLGQEVPKSVPPPLEAMQELIAMDPAHPWTIAELASTCNWSKGYFQRNCRTHLDCTPMELVYQLRLQKACTLLMEGSLTLESIADMCGFVDAYHFSRRFKQATGLPPGAWRKSAQA